MRFIFGQMLISFLIFCTLRVLLAEDEGILTSQLSQNRMRDNKNNTSYNRTHNQPRHVHLSFGKTSTKIVVTWSTINETPSSQVKYGIKQMKESRSIGTAEKFVAPGPKNLVQYIHRVILEGLVPGSTYLYHCGSEMGWSELFHFRLPQKETPIRLAVFGDFGVVNNTQNIDLLRTQAQLNSFDAILHVGDIAYNLDQEDGLVGDEFMDQIQPIAAYVPYMTCPGNHEQAMDFLHYKKRFVMPDDSASMYYSWDFGPIHFVSFNTEFYYNSSYSKILVDQFNWIKNDLVNANKPENRRKRPWIISYGHRPMYCKGMYLRCKDSNYEVRLGVQDKKGKKKYGLETLFMENGVDLSFWGHEHAYVRLLPLYRYRARNGLKNEPYKNPDGLVHIITGSAGSEEGKGRIKQNKSPLTAFQSTDYGFTRVKVFNSSHIYLEQVSTDQNGKVIDSFWLIRESHGAFNLTTK